ncbi:MAG: hypothetical protein O7H41_16910 [Planctomycetota bacterium]|nr:hypothetical protein [Planctomycetota bacterium]
MLAWLRERIERRDINVILAALVVILGLIYVPSTLSPSNYSVAVPYFGPRHDGLVLGPARPVRSDEWAVWTPLTQATVNNDFRRYNETSLYREDLRMVYAMPIFDWGMLFKPTMWLYPLVNAAYAFSFFHFAYMALFLFGYALLLQRLGVRKGASFLFSLILLFTGNVQYWWTTTGYIVAIFPWLLVVMTLRLGLLWRGLLFYWVAVCWLLSFFYPPFFIQLAFVAVIILAALKSSLLRLKPLLVFASSGIAAVATAIFYLRDHLEVMARMPYPGKFRAMGGDETLDLWLSQFLPLLHIQDHQHLVGSNICEIGVVGTFYVLMAACFLDYRRLFRIPRAYLRGLAIIGAGLLAVWAWMYLPLPSWVGAPILWDRVRPHRMFFASGFLMFLFAAVAARAFRLRVNGLRFCIYAFLVLAGWYLIKWKRHEIGFGDSILDWAILIPVGIIWGSRRELKRDRLHLALISAAAAMGLLAFGTFQPIQSAWRIFNRKETSITRILDRIQEWQGGDRLVFSGYPGALLNGWGYPSVAHVLIAHPTEAWKTYYPELSEEELETIFGQWSHVALTDEEIPSSPHMGIVHVPISTFLPWLPGAVPRLVVGDPGGALEANVGHLEQITREGSTVKVVGWAPWKDREIKDHTLYVLCDLPVRDLRFRRDKRFDVALAEEEPGFLFSGFQLEFETDGSGTPGVCLILEDPEGRRFLLAGDRATARCGGLLEGRRP